jgi:peroxiredoxin
MAERVAPLLERAASPEQVWLRGWTTGPTEDEGVPLATGTPAPDLRLLDQTGRSRRLSEFWQDGPALVMFWRHFGCTCGLGRAERLRTEYADYRRAGLNPVVVCQANPARAEAYRREQDLPCLVLSDPALLAYRAYGVGQWRPERLLYDAPPEYWAHPQDLGARLQEDRIAGGRPMVDDPWRGVAEVVVGRQGRVRLHYAYQYCEDYPDPRVLVAAAVLS